MSGFTTDTIHRVTSNLLPSPVISYILDHPRYTAFAPTSHNDVTFRIHIFRLGTSSTLEVLVLISLSLTLEHNPPVLVKHLNNIEPQILEAKGCSSRNLTLQRAPSHIVMRMIHRRLLTTSRLVVEIHNIRTRITTTFLKGHTAAPGYTP